MGILDLQSWAVREQTEGRRSDGTSHKNMYMGKWSAGSPLGQSANNPRLIMKEVKYSESLASILLLAKPSIRHLHQPPAQGVCGGHSLLCYAIDKVHVPTINAVSS